ncbi:hypothetical protein FSY75_16430 [Streptomyces sp. TR1341]|uniref:Uncharacterized protein n=1 Tax=Streptomyces murinus TaxID=33900 RepID=A0A7W3NTH6_STRMR|nr:MULTISPECIES: hypothetical protein [Streptomyces]MBA9056420.1 hypothetical protein [Streptomyces murinus]NDK26019.1 hypothetical protein [Streptomyces sp. TR1341]UWW90893.1 hypothetical protein GO605_08495 [Streptomyces murinus]
MTGRAVRWTLALACGAVWWWAVLRLALGQSAGVLEAAVAAGGWGLSVLPVHCAPKGKAEGELAPGRWAAAWRAGQTGTGVDADGLSSQGCSGGVPDP